MPRKRRKKKRKKGKKGSRKPPPPPLPSPPARPPRDDTFGVWLRKLEQERLRSKKGGQPEGVEGGDEEGKVSLSELLDDMDLD